MHRTADAADAALLRRTAARLRTRPGDAEARALAALLDLIAAELRHVSPGLRRATVAWCGRSRPRCSVSRRG